MFPPARRTVFVLAAAIAGLLTIRAAAMYVRVETENVPVDRLVKNLEALVADSPDDARLRFNLARVHAMAFATKAADVPTWKGNQKEGVWFGNEPPSVPYGHVRPGTPNQQAEARAHLERAIALHADAIAILDRTSPPPQTIERRFAAKFDLSVRLGYAWCIDQSGDRARAMAQYRDVLARAWESESQGILALGQPITPEAWSYLWPLLDPDKDAAEIALWNERAARINRMPRPVTPVAIPLRDDMTIDDVIAPNARVHFDADGSGLQRSWTWIGRDAGWLVYDQRGTRDITSALQWFGSVTFWLFWNNGYEPLQALDDNRDGTLAGHELDHLAIWRDENQNGVTDRGEFAPLSAWKITSLSCAYEVPDDARVAAMSRRGVRLDDGRVRPTWDVMLRAERVR